MSKHTDIKFALNNKVTKMSKFNLDNFYMGKLKEPVYEDNKCIVFDEKLNPQAPVHFLVFPKKAISKLSCASTEDEILLGPMLTVARKVAKKKGLNDSGFRVVINDGVHGGQTINLLCIQVLGGRQMTWPFA